MKETAITLLNALEARLNLLQPAPDTIGYSEAAIMEIICSLETLRTHIPAGGFENMSDEISFFKETKPLFSSRLILHNDILRIISTLPDDPGKSRIRHYKQQLKKINAYQRENADFIRYYRAGCTHLDHLYFVRESNCLKLPLDSFYLQSDHSFSTSQDYAVATLMAHETLCKWLHVRIAAIKRGSQPTAASRQQQWTAPKVALVELIYALHAEGVFNHGRAELNEVARLFENAFGIELGQYHRVFLEIRGRKTERTRFLSNLRERLLVRMEEADR